MDKTDFRIMHYLVTHHQTRFIEILKYLIPMPVFPVLLWFLFSLLTKKHDVTGGLFTSFNRKFSIDILKLLSFFFTAPLHFVVSLIQNRKPNHQVLVSDPLGFFVVLSLYNNVSKIVPIVVHHRNNQVKQLQMLIISSTNFLVTTALWLLSNAGNQ